MRKTNFYLSMPFLNIFFFYVCLCLSLWLHKCVKKALGEIVKAAGRKRFFTHVSQECRQLQCEL